MNVRKFIDEWGWPLMVGAFVALAVVDCVRGGPHTSGCRVQIAVGADADGGASW